MGEPSRYAVKKGRTRNRGFSVFFDPATLDDSEGGNNAWKRLLPKFDAAQHTMPAEVAFVFPLKPKLKAPRRPPPPLHPSNATTYSTATDEGKASGSELNGSTVRMQFEKKSGDALDTLCTCPTIIILRPLPKSLVETSPVPVSL